MEEGSAIIQGSQDSRLPTTTYLPTYRQVVGRAASGPAFQALESSGATRLP